MAVVVKVAVVVGVEVEDMVKQVEQEGWGVMLEPLGLAVVRLLVPDLPNLLLR